MYTTVRMEDETKVVRVPYTVTRTVQEDHVKQVPYQVVRMVPTKVDRVESFTTCKMVRKISSKTSDVRLHDADPMVNCQVPPPFAGTPYTYCVKVAYQTTEMVPTTVRKTVQVCVPYEVCVRKCRYVPVTPADCAPCAPAGNACGNACCDSGKARFQNYGGHLLGGCGNACDNQCKKPGLLERLFHRRFCCEPTCGSGCK